MRTVIFLKKIHKYTNEMLCIVCNMSNQVWYICSFETTLITRLPKNTSAAALHKVKTKL